VTFFYYNFACLRIVRPMCMDSARQCGIERYKDIERVELGMVGTVLKLHIADDCV